MPLPGLLQARIVHTPSFRNARCAERDMKICFVTNLCPHYRVRTYELLAKKFHVDFYFYTAGDEWYWQREHGTHTGQFRHVNLSGFSLGRTRIAPTLPLRLLRTRYDVFVKCINGRFALPATYMAAKLQGKPFVLWTGIWMRLQSPLHRLIHPITRQIYRKASSIVTYGEHVKRFLVGEGVVENRIFPARHAVDNALYEKRVALEDQKALRRKLDIPRHHRIILALGRLEPSKGLEYLIDSFADLNSTDVTLVIAGTGSLYQQLKERVDNLGLSGAVRFPGHVKPAETVRYYSIATIFILPSVTTQVEREPWGLVVNEAMNQGVPIVASESVGSVAGGLLRHEVNGLVVPERNMKQLSLAMSRLLNDSDFRSRLGKRARSSISTWTNESMVSTFSDAIHYAADRHQSRR